MKPFLLLSIRVVQRAADEEYAAMLEFSGLEEGQLRRVRMEQGPTGSIELNDWAGIILGGGPFSITEPVKSETQERVEAEIDALLDEVVAADFPFLGACYGIGTLGAHQGAVVDREHGEPVGPAMVTLTDAGQSDPLFAGIPAEFEAFVGHKEAIRRLPEHAVRLATSAACPVQAFRVGEHVYATQFHPELDVPGIETRIDVYQHAGYFDPGEVEGLKATCRAGAVTHPPTILANFVARYA